MFKPCIDSTLIKQAETLATVMHNLTQWPKSHINCQNNQSSILKLPPVFTVTNDEKYGNGQRNLVAMIKVLGEYEEGLEDGSYPTLAELPARYNAHGGLPVLTSKEMRKVHNWLQQVSFGVRAAMLDQEMRRDVRTAAEGLDAVDRVIRRLYANNNRRVFVTHAADNRYELKPLRYATTEAIKRWLREEYAQRQDTDLNYGARPSVQEWEEFGLKGQTKTITAAINAELENLMREAEAHDRAGRYVDADQLDLRMLQMVEHLDRFERLES